MNISLHGLMRYFQRFDDKLIGSEDSFKNFKRDNAEACVSAEKEINSMSNNESNIVFELTEKNNKIIRYIVNTDNRWIFVVDNNTLITCYGLKYTGISEETSYIIIKSLISEVLPKLKDKERLIIDLSNKKIEIENKNKDIDEEIKILRQRIECMQAEQKLLKEQIALEEIKLSNSSYELDNLVGKIVKPERFI